MKRDYESIISITPYRAITGPSEVVNKSTSLENRALFVTHRTQLNLSVEYAKQRPTRTNSNQIAPNGSQSRRADYQKYTAVEILGNGAGTYPS